MSTSQPTPEPTTPARSLAGFVPTPAEQAVLERIAAQRLRLRDERADEQAQAAHAAQVRAAQGGGAAGLVARVVRIARSYPALTAAIVGGGISLGPAKVARWGRILLPTLFRLWRR